ncbi:MAG: hypothetical protein Unbinned4336contig1000_48 [Prokaryotic dsDNA virus sp.]|nr:MAG: hypothetical protein Unbinned4336contig1000_48 [Prokaryotic dsDNA virus sp.]|tara:strand:- start:3655 stop:5937 length:2283 start_codon:yes stop_codon:yes gene_type:complete
MFGQPQRSATKDANEGVVYPPSKQSTARTVGTQQVQVREQPGLEAFANSVGNALQKRMAEEAVNINEQRANKAAVRQGQDHAINTVDAAKKHLGWEKAVFGENIEYRAAQQRAAQNAVQSAYLEQATQLDDYAGETPEQYAKRLESGLDKVLEPYGSDEETKGLVANAYNTASAKLAAKQYESHYAYNQQQQRETFYNQTLQTFDQWNVDKTLLSSPQETQGFMAGIQKFFRGATRPNGMSDIAWRGTINEALNTSLRNGNIGAYNAAKANGFLDGMSSKERVALDQAISAYDTDFTQDVQLTYENAELAAEEANNLEVAAGIYQNVKQEVSQLRERSSGTDRAELAIARAQTKAQKGINSAEEEAKRIAKKAYESALEKQAKQERIDGIKLALRQDDPIARAGSISELQPKKSELEEVMDLTIVEDVTRLTASDKPLTESAAVKAMIENPAVAKSVAARLRGRQVESPLVKRVTETFLNGFHGMIDENGQLNEKGIVAMQSISQFAQNDDTFKATIGSANFDKYEIIRRGMSVGQTVEMINKDIDSYARNKGNRDAYAIDWNLKGDESKRDRVTDLYRKFTGSAPNSASLAYAQEELDRGLVVYQGDMKAAEKYLRTSLINGSLNYRGRTIVNGKHLNNVTNYNFEQLMDGASSQVGQTSLITPILMAGGLQVDDDNPMGDLAKNMNFFTVDGTDGFFVDSNEFQQPIRVSSDTMKAWAAVLDQRKQFKELEEEAHGESFDRWYEEQEQLRSTGKIHLQ